ncbi:MAG: hypothetical protein JXR18_11340 [Neptuniibacter sp.]
MNDEENKGKKKDNETAGSDAAEEKKQELPHPLKKQRGMSLEEFLDPGEVFDAGYMNSEPGTLLDIATSISSSKPIRIVDEWTWLDIEYESEVMKMIENEGLQPVMLFALSIVYDSTQPDSVGNWVRTSMLKKFHAPGIFETRNRLYVMINSGRRKGVPPSYIDAIF